MNWLDKLLPLVGVIIGASLAPLLTSFLERSRAKRRLKPDLIKHTYEFFGLLKHNISLCNDHSYTINLYNALNEELANLDIKAENYEIQKNILAKDVSLLFAEGQRIHKEMTDNYYRHLESEANIQSLITQFSIYYDQSIYTRLSNAYALPVFKTANDQNLLFPYSKMDANELRDLYVKLEPAQDAKWKEIDNECSKLLNKLIVII